MPKSFLFTEEDKHLYELPQVLSISSVWLNEGMNKYQATYDLVVREMPPHRNFLVFSGLEEIIHDTLNWKYSNDEIKYLLKYKIINENFAKYLAKFKYSGDLYAMPEGSIFFPGEPIVRITAPLIEGNLLTMMMLNNLTSNTIFSSKAARMAIASGNKILIGPWAMRAHSWESSMKCSRAAYMTGGTIGGPSFYRKYGLDGKKISTIIIGYHAFIKSFDDELEAMRTLSKYAEDLINISVMVDTYDSIPGIKKAIQVAKEMGKKGKKMSSITIDSGDLYKTAVVARKMLDRAGLNDVKIALASNLDEYKISAMMKKNVPADTFIAATEGVTSADAPKLEAVFKIARLKSDSEVKYMAKLTEGKQSYPGLKNVYRQYDRHGKLKKDCIGLEGEKKLGRPLLKPFIQNGKLVQKLPSLDDIRFFCKSCLGQLPRKYFAINKEYVYPIKISKKLNDLMDNAKRQHLEK